MFAGLQIFLKDAYNNQKTEVVFGQLLENNNVKKNESNVLFFFLSLSCFFNKPKHIVLSRYKCTLHLLFFEFAQAINTFP